ncbi:MAG: hypothetical protein EBR87_01720 [Cytophagia bacterium]|nr:hypothetical protein [Cytophagia bacterium]
MNNIKHLFCFFAFSIFTWACSKETVVTPAATTTTGTTTTTPTPTVSASGFKLTSTAVVNGVLLDAFKCEKKVNGIENSIPLAWENAPAKANSFAITMVHYPNSSDSTKYNSYLLLWGIDKTVNKILYAEANKGPWFMGVNKDGNNISYTSPCSAGAGTHQYILTIYALSETPASLPTKSTTAVTYEVLTKAISTVTVLDKAKLIFNSVSP